MKWLVGAQVLDLVTAATMLSILGVSAEGNPMVAAVYAAAGLLGLVALKGVLLALLYSIRLAVTRPAWRIVVAMGVGFGLIGATSNVIAIIGGLS